MKNLIINSGMTLRQFSEFYEIPYGTVRQWYTEERKPPSYIVKLIKMAAKGYQMPITKNWYYFEVIEKTSGRTLRTYIFDSEEKREKLIKLNTGVTADTIILKKNFIEII